jgi:hypothetical protein
MGRRSGAIVRMTPEEILGRLRDRLVGFNMLPGVNRAQFEAQRYERDAVRLAWDLAQHPDCAVTFRLECIKFVVQTARGVPAPWFNRGETIDPNASGTALETVGAELLAVENMTGLYAEMDKLVREKVAYSKWPERIRGLAEAAAFADDETLEATPVAG